MCCSLFELHSELEAHQQAPGTQYGPEPEDELYGENGTVNNTPLCNPGLKQRELWCEDAGRWFVADINFVDQRQQAVALDAKTVGSLTRSWMLICSQGSEW